MRNRPEDLREATPYVQGRSTLGTLQFVERGRASATEAPTFVICVPLLRTPTNRALSTINSILGQSGAGDSFNLRVRVIARDLSGDLEHHLADLKDEGIEVEADQGAGLYAAVAQGLQEQDADFFGYLGGGDVFEPAAMTLTLEAVEACGRQDPLWVTGLIRGRREDGAIVRSLLPLRYTQRNFGNGLHGSILPTVQQESTLWSRSLNDSVDWRAVSKLHLAGDYLLWQTFLEVCEPVILEAAIGSFTWHGDNRSSDWERYEEEVRGLTRKATAFERIAAKVERAAWALPAPVKTRLSRQVRRYAWPAGPWL